MVICLSYPTVLSTPDCLPARRHAQNQNCESGEAPEELVAPLQAAKACMGQRVNKFGHWPVGMALPPVFVFQRE